MLQCFKNVLSHNCSTTLIINDNKAIVFSGGGGVFEVTKFLKKSFMQSYNIQKSHGESSGRFSEFVLQGLLFQLSHDHAAFPRLECSLSKMMITRCFQWALHKRQKFRGNHQRTLKNSRNNRCEEEEEAEAVVDDHENVAGGGDLALN